MADDVIPAPLPEPVPQKFARGAIPTPRHILAGAHPFCPVPTLFTPTQFAVVPTQLSMWYNNQTGDCVTAQEAFSKAAWSVMNGYPELFIPDAEVKRWAQKYGFWNGAMLTDVMDQMAKDGFTVGGVNYHDGPYKSVNYGDEAILQAAILVGPVNIAIDANALPPGAGNQQGWHATGGSPGQYPNTDHCVALSGFGTAAYLYSQLGVPLPAGLSPTAEGYLLFTWSTIGFVDHAWLMSTCTEAWVRNPTTPEQAPTPPVPPPVPPTPPTPPTPPQPIPAHVDIPALTVRLFGVRIASTDPTTVPVVYQAGIGVNWGSLFTDVLKLAADATAGNWVAVFGDVMKIVADLRNQRIGAVNWTQLITDLGKLWSDYTTNAPIQTVWADFLTVLNDLGV